MKKGIYRTDPHSIPSRLNRSRRVCSMYTLTLIPSGQGGHGQLTDGLTGKVDGLAPLPGFGDL